MSTRELTEQDRKALEAIERVKSPVFRVLLTVMYGIAKGAAVEAEKARSAAAAGALALELAQRCPRCGALWPVGVGFCPNDGARRERGEA